MRRFVTLLCSLLAALGLVACDYFNLKELEPGVSTAADVRQRFGPPQMEWHNDDGSVTWEYSRQPMGTECFMMTIGTDDVLRKIEQVLNENNFARIQRGMTGDEVRRILGAPGTRERFDLAKETVWGWRVGKEASGDPVFFLVHFNDDARVSRTSRFVEQRG